MPFQSQITTSGRETFDDGDEFNIDLPTSSPAQMYLLNAELDYTIASTPHVAHEDGWGALIQSFNVQASGGRPPIKVDGYGAMLLAELAQMAELNPAPTLPVAVGAHTARLQLPFFLNMPGYDDPFEAYYNPRGLAAFQLELSLRDIADVLTTGGAISAISGRAWVTSYLRGDLAARDPTVPAPFVSRSVMSFGAAQSQTLQLRVGGSITHLLLVARTAAPLAGARSDAVIDTVGLRMNNRTELVKPTPWRVFRSAATATRRVPLDTGVALIDFDTVRELDNASLVPAGGAAVQSLELEVESAAAANLYVYPVTLKL